MDCAAKKIDPFSYQLGVMDCFNEMVHAGVKRIALSHPSKTKEERDGFLESAGELCQRYGTKLYPEDEPLITDLFPRQLNENTWNIIFYREEKDLEEYKRLKQKKRELEEAHAYTGEARRKIAEGFGQLLGYTEEAIERKIRETLEEEAPAKV